MAKIVSSDLAPSEAVHYSLANVEFDLGGSGKKTYETDDPDVIANALSHPWLKVEYPKVTVESGVYFEQIDPKDDPLSRFYEGPVEDTVAVVREPIDPLAIDAGENQNDVVRTGRVDETLAADDKGEPVVVEVTPSPAASAASETSTEKKES